MKLQGRQSTNIEDRTQDTSVYAPHRNPFDKTLPANQIIARSRGQDAAAQRAYDKMMVQKATSDPNNPFGKMIKGMNKANMPPVNPNAKIPIPTPRPDPNSGPLPKILRYNNNKG